MEIDEEDGAGGEIRQMVDAGKHFFKFFKMSFLSNSSSIKTRNY